MYEDLIYNNIKYVHFNKPSPNNEKTDTIDFRISDGKNDVTATLNIVIIGSENNLPVLKSTFQTRVKELGKKILTKNELNIIDADTPPENLKFIITHPPQYGVIEKVDKSQSAGVGSTSSETNYMIAVTEFTLKELQSGLICYSHNTPGAVMDRFGFVIYDGTNNMFIVNGVQVSTVQVFTLYVDAEVNQAPTIERNLGIDYLYQINGAPGRVISNNELNIADKDDQSKDLIITILRQPSYGILEHKDKTDTSVTRFTQEDINQNKITYILKTLDDTVSHDHFIFDVQDSAKHSIKNNRFDIKWSVLNFELNEITVMESEGKVRVHIIKNGNLKQYSTVTCKTMSDTAKSNRDSKYFDFVHTVIKVEFNEGESYKACDIVIQKDSQVEPIESFYIVLEDSKYSVVGSQNRVKVNILDKQKGKLNFFNHESSLFFFSLIRRNSFLLVAVIELDRVKFEVQESDKLVSIPVMRTGDLSTDVQVECFTQDETAQGNLDYVPRQVNSFNYNLVKIAAGEKFGFCDIELIDDDLHEIQSESFKVVINNPSKGAQIGTKNEAKIIIIGPNDGLLK